MERVRRPDRSDVHLSKEEEAKMEDEVRENFENLAPKRHTKPQRSDYSSQYVDAFANGSDSNQDEVTQEFQETEYYKDLNRINKDHHTTGTGFIKMENANGKSFILAPDNDDAHHSSCKGNPATNEWIPSADDSTSQKGVRIDDKAYCLRTKSKTALPASSVFCF
ncbi:hypothetical protein CUMW_032800 [Citrus unshiu]|nr:hypothetical protein CUMW_032800 [Citrus unshiu]